MQGCEGKPLHDGYANFSYVERISLLLVRIHKQRVERFVAQRMLVAKRRTAVDAVGCVLSSGNQQKIVSYTPSGPALQFGNPLASWNGIQPRMQPPKYCASQSSVFIVVLCDWQQHQSATNNKIEAQPTQQLFNKASFKQHTQAATNRPQDPATHKQTCQPNPQAKPPIVKGTFKRRRHQTRRPTTANPPTPQRG